MLADELPVDLPQDFSAREMHEADAERGVGDGVDEVPRQGSQHLLGFQRVFGLECIEQEGEPVECVASPRS